MISEATRQLLINLGEDQSNGWVTADLKITPSSAFGRFFWPIAARFEWIQRIFYSLNLAESQRNLKNIKAEILTNTDQHDSIRGIFDKACKRYNRMAPNKFKVHPINSKGRNKTHRPQNGKNSSPLNLPSSNAKVNAQTQTQKTESSPKNPSQPDQNSRIQETASRISVLTYNVLFPQLPGKHESPFSTEIGYSQDHEGNVYENSAFRQEIVLQNILNSKSDIHCLQEVSQDHFNKLSAALEKEGYKGEYRYHNRKHGVAIFYKQDKFQQLDSFHGHFAVQKVDQNGQKLTLQDGRPDLNKRVHLVVDLKDKATQKVIRVASCHFHDPSIVDNKTGHVDAVLHTLSKRNNYRLDKIVVAGDFNQDQWGDKENPQTTPDLRHASALKPLFREGFLVDADLSPSEFERSDSKNYNSRLIPNNRKIDHIFVKSFGGNSVQPIAVPFPKFDPRGSDHRAVMTAI